MPSELHKLVERYRSMLKLKLVVLFGSRARGDYTDISDVDILVVADDLPKILGILSSYFAILNSPTYIH